MRKSLLLAFLFITTLLSACDEKVVSGANDTIVIASGTENQVFFEPIQSFAKAKGYSVQFVSKGSVEIANDLSQGKNTPYDIVWAANSTIIEGTRGHAVKNLTSIMITPIMPIVKKAKAEAFGWTKKAPTNTAFYQAVIDGKLRLGMSVPSQDYAGQAAYLGMISSLAGSPEVLQMSHLENPGLTTQVKEIFGAVSKSSASAGALTSFMISNIGYDAMVNYEGLAFEANRQLSSGDSFCALMPQDGVVVADNPIGYIDKGNARKAAFFEELVGYLKSSDFKSLLKQQGRRGDMSLLLEAQKISFDPCWDTDRPIKILTFPTREVVEKAIDIYQSSLRKPTLTVYLGDFSGSMSGAGEKQLKAAMNVLWDQNEAAKWFLQATPKDVNIFIPFSGSPWTPIVVKGNDSEGFKTGVKSISSLSTSGGTEIYLGIMAAIDQISRIQNLPHYSVSIILMTDGDSSKSEYDKSLASLKAGFEKNGIAIYSIMFGAANPKQLIEITRHQVGGNDELAKLGFVCDGRKDLIGCFRRIRANN